MDSGTEANLPAMESTFYMRDRLKVRLGLKCDFALSGSYINTNMAWHGEITGLNYASLISLDISRILA